MISRPKRLAIVFLIVLNISLKDIYKQHQEIKENIKTKYNETTLQDILTKKDKKLAENKIHLEKRIENFLKENNGVRFTELELKSKIALDICDVIEFHRTLIKVTFSQHQHALGYGIEANHSNVKKPIFYYYFETLK